MGFDIFKKKQNEEVTKGELLLKCPKCNKDMKKIKKEGIIVDVCSQCRGMWLDDKEIDKLLEIARRGNKDGKKK